MVKARSYYDRGPVSDYTYKPIRETDHLRLSQFTPTNQRQEYRPNQPTNVNSHRETPRERKAAKNTAPNTTRTLNTPRKTFESYGFASGPDIKTNKMGPEYNIKPHEHKPYKPTTPYKPSPKSATDPLKSKPSYFDRRVEPYNGNVEYKLTQDNNAGMRNWNYGFVEDTVAAKRPTDKPKQKYAVKERQTIPKKENTKTLKKTAGAPKVSAAVVPVSKKTEQKQFTSSSTQHYSPATKTIPTQTKLAQTKTFGTQYQPKQTKAFGTQSDQTKTSSTAIQINTTSPLPSIVPIVAPLTQSSKTFISTKHAAVQCSELPRKTTARSTQYKGPVSKVSQTQTLPFFQHPEEVPVTNRAKTPENAQVETRWNSPKVYREPPRRPSLEILPLVTASNHRRSPTPQERSNTRKKTYTENPVTSPQQRSSQSRAPVRPASYSRWTPSPDMAIRSPIAETNTVSLQRSPPRHHTPVVTRTASPKQQPATEMYSKPETYVQSSNAIKQLPMTGASGPFHPLNKTKRGLPPEVSACIEAYDSAHGPTGDALPSIMRGMRLG